ncbi:LysR family transcriptional regulator [Castellaniella sp.]|uniref:LysR family transcriptional regulator n=1 Tax=Castellaniella sp. TaxID=1955812 RepID=UPI002AFE86B6|nr:LysR family transcriptional regulator [Castellaniella sp.]
MDNRLPKLDWNDLRFFLAVARKGGLTPAAQDLRTSPATVSRRIDALERATGMALFLRRQTGYTLTEEGERLLASALPVEHAIDSLLRQTQISGDTNPWHGTVRLATSDTVAIAWIAPHLPGFLDAHPGLQIEVLTGFNMVNLSRRDADIALRMAPPAPEEEGDYVAAHAGAMPFAAYATAAALAGGADWRTLPHISWSEPLQHIPLAKWTDAAFKGRTPRLLSNSLPFMAAAAHAGAGVIVLPTSIGDADPRLQRIEPDHMACVRDLWIVYHRDLRSSRLILAVKAFLLDIVTREGMSP